MGSDAKRTRTASLKACATSGADSARTSNVTGSSWLAITMRTAAESASPSRTPSLIVFEAAGRGASLKVALTIAARLPNDPVTSFERS